MRSAKNLNDYRVAVFRVPSKIHPDNELIAPVTYIIIVLVHFRTGLEMSFPHKFDFVTYIRSI